MNEAGVFGRFVPRFRPRRGADAIRHVSPLHGRRAPVRAIGMLAEIETGAFKEHAAGHDLMRDDSLAPRCSISRCCCTTSPRAAAATIRSPGADRRGKLVPAAGLSPAETETVAWLVRWHLLMSARAQARHRRSADHRGLRPRVQSPERLKLLLMLTVADIRAVGPKSGTAGRRRCCAPYTMKPNRR